MPRVFNEGEKGRIVQFLSHPNLLQLFSDYVFIKGDVVERLAIEENDENVNAIFLLLFAGIFVKRRDDISDVFSAAVLNYSGFRDAGFFVGKEKYLLKGILKLVAEEFFLPHVSVVPHRKVRSFAELFDVVLGDSATSTDLSNKKEATVQICLKVLTQLSKYQDAIGTYEEFDTVGALRNLADLYDVIDEAHISLQEFYLCYENGMLNTLHTSTLLSRAISLLYRIPGFKVFMRGITRFINWVKNIW